VKLHRAFDPVLADSSARVDLTPEDAGWSWTGIQVLALTPGVPTTVRTGP